MDKLRLILLVISGALKYCMPQNYRDNSSLIIPCLHKINKVVYRAYDIICVKYGSWTYDIVRPMFYVYIISHVCMRHRVCNVRYRVSILKHVAYDIVRHEFTYYRDIVGVRRTISDVHIVYDIVHTCP